ncbi:MAG: type IV toxin-antitoxin system AbiEi family antitoxin domain-containing protein [Ornithinimicrobium sp.]
MDPRLSGVLARRSPAVFTASEAYTVGLDAGTIHRLCRRGEVIRLASGTYTSAEVWSTADPIERHLLLAASRCAALEGRGDISLALSHDSAAAWWGLPLLCTPKRGHLTLCGPGAARTRAEYTVHRRYGVDQCSTYRSVDTDSAEYPRLGHPRVQVRTVSPVLAAFGVAETRGFLAGVVALDGALHSAKAQPEDAVGWLSRLRRRPGMATIRSVVKAADALAESPLETQARVVLQSLGYRPRLQARLLSTDGHFVARVDLLIEDLGVVVEVDGRVKYQQHNSTQALVSEKRRENAIVDLGYAVFRLEHHHLADPKAIDACIQQAARRAHSPQRRSTRAPSVRL